MTTRFLIVFLLLTPLAAVLICPTLQAQKVAQQNSASKDVLDDPVVLGAYVYRNNCVRCHSTYGEARLAEEYDAEDELHEAIAGQGCRLSWAREAGGELGRSEIEGLTAYMFIWERENREPELPMLPPPPEKPEQRPISKKMAAAEKTNQKKSDHDLPPALMDVLSQNRVAFGGYLYTRNCYRCHLSYERSRLGRDSSEEALIRIIQEGKTSTQMKPFSQLLGGKLKNSEIKAIATYILTWERLGETVVIADALLTPPAIDPSDLKPFRLPRFPMVEGDSEAGVSLYKDFCTSCHGDRGEGKIGPSLTRSQARIRPDLYFKGIMKKGIPHSLMKGWGKEGGGNFTAKDIDDVVALLMSWSIAKDHK